MGTKQIEELENTPGIGAAMYQAMTLDNLGVVTPHKEKFYARYNIDWLINEVKRGTPLTFVTFWKADEGEENNMLSQWYRGEPIIINGRKYDTAEQYMMSEKALLFKDTRAYNKIMEESDPAVCKKLGKGVQGFNQKVWDGAFREIIFHGNLGKLQSDINIVDALIKTENAVLIEASPLDDIYGAGLAKDYILNDDGTLKTLPQDWHKAGETRQAQNHLGFVLMGIRDLFCECMRYRYLPGMEQPRTLVWGD